MADVMLTPKQLAELLNKLDLVAAQVDAFRAVLFQAMADRRVLAHSKRRQQRSPAARRAAKLNASPPRPRR